MPLFAFCVKPGDNGEVKRLIFIFGGVMLSASLCLAAFSDLSSEHEYAEAIAYAEEVGLMEGYEDGTARPERAVSRAEFVKLLVAAEFAVEVIESCELEVGRFSDVDASDWFEPYVCQAVEVGWVQGYADGHFGPKDTINFVEAAKLASEALGYDEGEEGEEWYSAYVNAMTDRAAVPQTVNGHGHEMTRGETAELLYRLLEELTDRETGALGWFKTGQQASLMVSGFGFGETGGLALYNHQAGIASDGQRLALADRNNNRVLLWNELPEEGDDPDLVLGQDDFWSNAPGSELDELNWPTTVTFAGDRLVVADAENDRILIWEEWPSENKAAADYALHDNIRWPWGLWSDGEMLMVASTANGSVPIWHEFPEFDDAADLVLKVEGFGTPRTVFSDGTGLMVSDHNSVTEGHSGGGTFFWNELPSTADEAYDFFMPSPGGDHHGEVLWGPSMDDEGQFWALGQREIYRWGEFPTSNVAPDLRLGGDYIRSGDTSGMTVVGDRLYASMTNANKVLVFETLPEKAADEPDFVLGAEDVMDDTLIENGILSNGVPATDGESLVVTSDFDKKMYIWQSLPTESGQAPDLIMDMEYTAWDNALHGDVFMVGNKAHVAVWTDGLPIDGAGPEAGFNVTVDGEMLQQIQGVALDDKYIYVGDSQRNAVYAWTSLDGLMSGDAPAVTLDMERPWRLSSNGEHLVVVSGQAGGRVHLYTVDDLNAAPFTVGDFGWEPQINLPSGAFIAEKAFFIADTGFHRVLAWESVDSLKAGDMPTVLGEDDINEHDPQIGRDKLFWPAALAYDGNTLWVGEFKFSARVLRFDH